MRDATRGGVATVLNEFATASGVSMHLQESSVPIRESVRGACEILGLDPLYLANEGNLVAVVPPDHAEQLIAAMQTHPAGKHSAVIGTVKEAPVGIVFLSTSFGGTRIVDTLVGEQLPRIQHCGDSPAGGIAHAPNVESDTQPLHGLIARMLDVCPDIRCMRDATRGGVATVLNEFATASGVSMHLQESSVPIRESVRGACEILGLDPLYLANEGNLVAVVPPDHAEQLIAAMQTHPAGKHSAVIGTVKEAPVGIVVLSTSFGGTRIVDTLVGEQLPRIC